MLTHMHIDMRMHTQHTHLHVHMCTHVHRYPHVHVCEHRHTCTYTHIHKRIYLLFLCDCARICRHSNKHCRQSPALYWCFLTRKGERERIRNKDTSHNHATRRKSQGPAGYLRKLLAPRLWECGGSFQKEVNFSGLQFQGG